MTTNYNHTRRLRTAALRVITLMAFLMALPGLAKAQTNSLKIDSLPTDKQIDLTYESDGWSYSWDGQAKTPFNGTLTGTLTTANAFNIKDMDGAATLNITDANIKGTLVGTPLFYCNHSKEKTLTILLNNSTLTSLPIFDAAFQESGPVVIRVEGTEPCVINGNINLARNDLKIEAAPGKALTINGRISAGQTLTNDNNEVHITGNIRVNGGVRLQGDCILTVGADVKVANANGDAFTKTSGSTTQLNSPILQWTYADNNIPKAGQLTIKKEKTEEVATFTTDGKRKSFGIGGVTDQTYTVWYTPDGGKPDKQSDADGKTEFKLTKDSLLSNTGMKAVGPITPNSGQTSSSPATAPIRREPEEQTPTSTTASATARTP